LTVKLKHKNLLAFTVTVLVTVGIGTFVYIYEIPPLIYNGWEQGIVQEGLGGGPMPVNTLYTQPNLASPNSTKSNLAAGARNRDTLYTVGVLDLSKGPEILSVPAMGSRYCDIELVDSRGDDFAYVGSRTTGGQAGNFLISGPGSHGTVPQGVTQITSPDNKVLLIGRVLMQNDTDLSTAYSLSTQIQLTPLSSWQPKVG
jgi:hypothetical protein